MKRFLILFSCSVLALNLIFFFIPLGRYNKIYTDIIRLHVIANSDSDADQALKLSVRDELLTQVKELLSDCKDTQSAHNLLSSNLKNLESNAQNVICSLGFEYDVSTSLNCEFYPTKEYGELKLPCGEYKSLKVIIGEGEGQNWWCVLFPPVCTGSASVKEELSETGFTSNQIKLITETDSENYEVKFKCLEYLSQIKEKIKKLFS